ncbi:unnamed protein product [Closterium sp. Yama58-4]|nr:unnamed protein product [Closterium sp. Yama58-4]
MASRSFRKQLFGATGVALLLVAASLAQLPTTTRAIPVTDLESPSKPYDIHFSLVRHLFALDGTKDISNMTILLPQLDALYAASVSYPRHDNATRKFDRAIADALACMYEGGASGEQCAVGQNVSAAVAGAMLDIWKFQIVKHYIPPSVAMHKYSSIDNQWELPTMHGQPLWISYSPMYGGVWNISGVPPQKQASELLFPRRTLINSYGHVIDDGTPRAVALVESGDVLLDVPSSEVVVYRSDAVLIPHKRDALGAYAGATASVFHLLISICLALCALLLLLLLLYRHSCSYSCSCSCTVTPVNTPLLL